MKKIILLAGIIASFLTVSPLAAQVNVFPQCGDAAAAQTAVCRGGGTLFGAGSIWNRILNIVTYVAGAAAVLVIILGGIRYITSNGDQSQITSAKNTILYALIGLVVAMMANAIINFVLTGI